MKEWINQLERAQLVANGRNAVTDGNADPVPLVLLFAPDGDQRWLIAELDPEDPDLAYGICDLGIGLPETGHVRLSWIAALRGPLGMPVERSASYAPSPSLTLSKLLAIAVAAGRITT